MKNPHHPEEMLIYQCLVCRCQAADHALIAGVDDQGRLHLAFQRTPKRFWERLWTAIKILFKIRDRSGHWAAVVLDEPNILALANLMACIEKPEEEKVKTENAKPFKFPTEWH